MTQNTDDGAQDFPAGKRSPVWWLLLVLAVIAILMRLVPLLDPQRNVFWFFMTEDGYLMQTVARNIAIGLGMSTAEGTIPTNGVQPLATFAFAAMHALAGGSKFLGIVYVTVLSAAIVALATYLLWKLAAELLGSADVSGEVALLIAAAWAASPLVMRHSANGLETGVYYLAIIGTLLYYFSVTREQAGLRLSQQLLLGLLLGLAFLARNDAVFFIAAVLLAHLVAGGRANGGLKRRFIDCIVAGVTSIAVASPWLISNQLRFGSIVPMSGTAESFRAAFASNLSMIPANFLESMLLYVPIPQNMESSPPVVGASLLLLAAAGMVVWREFARGDLARMRMVLMTAVFAACIGGYYGLFFGAAHFITRYVSALTPLLAVTCIASAWFITSRLLRNRNAALGGWAGLLIVAFLGSNVLRVVQHYRHELNNGHRQVVEWVTANVDDRDWVGAVQTGTLGFFHDRTINLDGKVNPLALREQIEKGDIRPYALSRTPVNYIADWIGVTTWVAPTDPAFERGFEVVVKDKARNLGVLRRVEPIALD